MDLATILSYIQTIPLDTVLQALAAAGILSVVVQKIKKWLSIQSSGVINFVNGVLAFTAVSIQYLTTAIQSSPMQLPSHALALMSLMITMYHLPYVGIKSLSQLAADVKAVRERKARVDAQTTETVEETPEVPIDSVQAEVPLVEAPVEPVATTEPEPQSEFGA